jgi:hypothetical protein
MKVTFKLNVIYEKEETRERVDEFSDVLEIPDELDDDERFGFNRQSFGEMLFTLYLLVFAKSVQYGDSWQKRGEVRGPIANLDRKYDRIMKSIEQWQENGKNDPYPRIDGSADLAVYALLYLSTYLREHYPDAFEKWRTEEVESFLSRYRSLHAVEKQDGESSPEANIVARPHAAWS